MPAKAENPSTAIMSLKNRDASAPVCSTHCHTEAPVATEAPAADESISEEEAASDEAATEEPAAEEAGSENEASDASTD